MLNIIWGWKLITLNPGELGACHHVMSSVMAAAAFQANSSLIIIIIIVSDNVKHDPKS